MPTKRQNVGDWYDIFLRLVVPARCAHCRDKNYQSFVMPVFRSCSWSYWTNLIYPGVPHGVDRGKRMLPHALNDPLFYPPWYPLCIYFFLPIGFLKARSTMLERKDKTMVSSRWVLVLAILTHDSYLLLFDVPKGTAVHKKQLHARTGEVVGVFLSRRGRKETWFCSGHCMMKGCSGGGFIHRFLSMFLWCVVEERENATLFCCCGRGCGCCGFDRDSADPNL